MVENIWYPHSGHILATPLLLSWGRGTLLLRTLSADWYRAASFYNELVKPVSCFQSGTRQLTEVHEVRTQGHQSKKLLKLFLMRRIVSKIVKTNASTDKLHQQRTVAGVIYQKGIL